MILKAKKTIEKINKTKFVLWKNNAIDQSDWQVLTKKMRRHKLPSFCFYMENGKKFKVLRKGNK